MSKRLPVRWVTDPDDLPREGEFTARLAAMPGWDHSDTIRAAGRPAPSVSLADDGRLAAVTEPKPTDLHVRRVRLTMIVRAADGREIVAGFGPHAGSPQVDAEAPKDLRDAAIEAWRGRPPRGRPSELDDRVARIVEAARDLGAMATIDTVAQRLGRVTADLERQGDYNRDVADAGGWAEIKRRAEL